MDLPSNPPNGMVIPYLISNNIATATKNGKLVRFVVAGVQYSTLRATNSATTNQRIYNMKRYLLIAILALQVVLLSSCNTKKDSALLLPNRTDVISVSISCDDERETITDKREIDDLFANLSTVRIKSGESYNDSPMTDKFIKIFFEVSDGLSGCVVYVFEDENGFFILRRQCRERCCQRE